jgi:hypothetical protein
MKALIVVTLIAGTAATAGAQQINGRYVEARTAAVMAGACHYNGELVTRGRDAILAFKIEGGKSGAVDLTGVNALAIVTSDENLSQGAARRSVLVIDAAADDVRAAAAAEALRARYATTFGTVEVRRAPVRFVEQDGHLTVDAPGYASMSVQALADRPCCKMPHTVWYEPLVPLADRQVGYTEKAQSAAFIPWMDAGENTAFHGRF